MKEYVQSFGLDQCSLRATNQEQEGIPYIVQIPRRITREELTQLIPLEWITNYNRLHVDRRPIQSQEATFRRSIDKTVKTISKKLNEGSTSMSPIFQTMMIKLVLKEDWCPVHTVTTEGKLIYTDKIDGHFIWDVDPTRWRCKPSPPPQIRFDPDNGTWAGIHGKKKPLSIYEEGLKILRKEGLLSPDDPTLITWSRTDHCKALHPPAIVQPIPCFTYSAATLEYERKFPSLERKMDPIIGRTSKPFIHPSEVQPGGKLKPLTQAEEVLNWKSENMVSQNEILQSLDKRVDKIVEKIDETDDNLKVLSQKMQKHYRSLKAQVSQLDRDLRQMLEERTFGKTFDQKEREIINLQGQTPPPKIQKEEETPDKGFQAMAITRKYESSQENHHFAETSTHKKDESSTDSDNNSDQETSTDETPGYVSSKSESEDNYIPRLFMENIKEEDSFFEEESAEETLIPERIKPNGGPWFTVDDIPPSLRRKRLLEFGAWLDTQMMKTSENNYKIIEEFCCRMTGTMKEWYHNLGTFKQDELHRLETTANILGVLHREFVGDMEIFDRKNRQEFFEMK
ncbi:hypothetical protein KIW84_076048 [Lathyrus oleraceus]|uniref:Polyprotein n=1 Tax=Pisum sativum TaxID=3888 RepID=A0A9D4VVM0_PEA|nr:hypothetical protein KIW84_076048 [Pisum sativum]